MKITLWRDLPTEHWHSMERYADELGRSLRQIGCEVEAFVPARPFPKLHGAPNTLLNYAWRALVYPRAARKHQGEVNHILDHSYAHLIRALDASRTVVTCHDIAPLALNRGRGIARRLWDESFRAMLRATRIIADSTFTRAEILRHSDYPAERIQVVPLAVSPTFFERVAESERRAWCEQHGLGSRRIVLHVGSCEPRKNIEAILRALDHLSDPSIVFAQIGGRFTPAQRKWIAQKNLRHRVLQIPFANESELRTWYQLAQALVLPSYYEGFGLPILEAMASRTPVICANASSLPEIAGDPSARPGSSAALLIDAGDAVQLAEAIRSVLSDSTLAADLIARGNERAKMFSWERTAREMLAVYEQLA